MEKNPRVVFTIIVIMLAASLGLGYVLGGTFVGARTGTSGHQQYADITLIQTGGYKYAAADNDTHDAFTPTDFTVYVGQTVNLTIANYDTMAHSFTSTALGVNFNVPGNVKDGVPAVVHYQFRVDKPGTFRWWCAVPCDQPSLWAMAADKDGSVGQLGYMGGIVTVLA